MGISVDLSKLYAVVRLTGSLDAEDREAFVEQTHPLVAEQGSKLVIDLDQLTSISSAGLSALVSVTTRARLAEGRVILVAPTSFVRGILEVTQLENWFEVCDDCAEAQRRLS